MTVLEVIQRSTAFLAGKGVESPRLQVELLLAHVLQMPRLKLYLNFQQELGEPALQAVRDLVSRRGRREPLQYLVGTTSFCGREIRCTSAALIPRPETELLAERGWQFLQPLPNPRLLDLGTGTGCIAISILANVPAAHGVAVDLSAAALDLARQNAAANNVAGRLEFVKADAFKLGDGAGLDASLAPPFDLVVSNPPYIATEEVKTLQPEIREFEPALALDGGGDGLECFRAIAAQAAPLVRPGGKIMLECGLGQERQLQELFTSEKWVVEEIVPDYSSHPRILIARPEAQC